MRCTGLQTYSRNVKHPSHIRPFEMWICPANYIMYTRHDLWNTRWVFRPKAQRESTHSVCASLLVKFRRRVSGYAELLQPARRRRLERASRGTRSVGLSSRLVREYAIPKYSGVAIFSEHTDGRQLAACTRTAYVRAIYNGGLLNSAALNRAQNFKQFAAWHADSSYKAREICTDFCIGSEQKDKWVGNIFRHSYSIPTFSVKYDACASTNEQASMLSHFSYDRVRSFSTY